MRRDYRQLRLHQLARSLSAFKQAREVVRPRRGWLRAIREASGMTMQQLGAAMGVTRQHIAFFEKSEADDRITLKTLKRAAEGLGCELVYALVPKSGSLSDLAKAHARRQATENVLAVEHSMALENQPVGRVKEKIEQEARRVLEAR
jgi:predicted DNA-binding mobile mystery protein A